ncbi:hypothetical protein AB0E78_13195 [Streptomyces sp. NPDC032198]|uniref:hypothetical protein n=1 Tax=Streptomyces sp. NPDC032198 TaxID=3155127 RepID=UPI0033CAFDB4
MTDAEHLTPRETPREQGMGSGTPRDPAFGSGTPRDPAVGSGTPRDPAMGSGTPAPAPAPAHAANRSPAAGSPATGSPAHAAGPGSESGPVLLAQDERDKLGLRLQQALSTFVDSPRQAVEEADGLFDDAVRHLTETLTERRRTLREGWQGHDTEAHTEELRLALRQYREATERLLRI